MLKPNFNTNLGFNVFEIDDKFIHQDRIKTEKEFKELLEKKKLVGVVNFKVTVVNGTEQFSKTKYFFYKDDKSIEVPESYVSDFQDKNLSMEEVFDKIEKAYSEKKEIKLTEPVEKKLGKFFHIIGSILLFLGIPALLFVCALMQSSINTSTEVKEFNSNAEIDLGDYVDANGAVLDTFETKEGSTDSFITKDSETYGLLKISNSNDTVLFQVAPETEIFETLKNRNVDEALEITIPGEIQSLDKLPKISVSNFNKSISKALGQESGEAIQISDYFEAVAIDNELEPPQYLLNNSVERVGNNYLFLAIFYILISIVIFVIGKVLSTKAENKIKAEVDYLFRE